MRETTMHPAALRRVLLLDAIACGAMSILLVLAANPLESQLGLPVSLLRWSGAVLVPFAGLLVWTAPRAGDYRGLVRSIAGANALWVIASVLLLLSGWVSPTRLGAAFVVLQAAVVALFAYLEHRGAARDGASVAARGAALGQR